MTEKVTNGNILSIIRNMDEEESNKIDKLENCDDHEIYYSQQGRVEVLEEIVKLIDSIEKDGQEIIKKDELLNKMGDAIGLIQISMDNYNKEKIMFGNLEVNINESLKNLNEIKDVLKQEQLLK